jgi:hypothetical protein
MRTADEVRFIPVRTGSGLLGLLPADHQQRADGEQDQGEWQQPSIGSGVSERLLAVVMCPWPRLRACRCRGACGQRARGQDGSTSCRGHGAIVGAICGSAAVSVPVALPSVPVGAGATVGFRLWRFHQCPCHRFRFRPLFHRYRFHPFRHPDRSHCRFHHPDQQRAASSQSLRQGRCPSQHPGLRMQHQFPCRARDQTVPSAPLPREPVLPRLTSTTAATSAAGTVVSVPVPVVLPRLTSTRAVASAAGTVVSVPVTVVLPRLTSTRAVASAAGTVVSVPVRWCCRG